MSKPFQFKQFSLQDNQCSMKIGTDGVLLGAWAGADHAKRVLDIGTGSGLIALMLAQRTPAETRIEAVEIGMADTLQAKENAAASPWKERIHIHHARIQDFDPSEKFDLIVSNPPFFTNGPQPPAAARKAARHTSTLTYEELLNAVLRLLTDSGLFSVILPVQEGNSLITMAQFKGLYPQRQLALFTRQGKAQERWLIEFSRTPSISSIQPLFLYEGQNQRSEGYHNLTKAFYL